MRSTTTVLSSSRWGPFILRPMSAQHSHLPQLTLLLARRPHHDHRESPLLTQTGTVTHPVSGTEPTAQVLRATIRDGGGADQAVVPSLLVLGLRAGAAEGHGGPGSSPMLCLAMSSSSMRMWCGCSLELPSWYSGRLPSALSSVRPMVPLLSGRWEGPALDSSLVTILAVGALSHLHSRAHAPV